MAYARFSYSDVYVLMHCHGELICCGCLLPSGGPNSFTTTDEMLAHLDQHKAAGHNVPDDCYDGLRADAEENDDWMAKVAAGMCPTCSGTGRCPQPHPSVSSGPCPCHDSRVCYACGGARGTKEWAAAHPTPETP